MAVGVHLAGPAAHVAGPMNAALAAAALPAVTTTALLVLAGYASAAPRAYTAPVMPAMTAAGAILQGHDANWFDRIHVVPRTADVGVVLLTKVLDVEVWNAHRRGHTLASTSVTGSAGVAVSPGALPHVFPSLHSEIHPVQVLATGSDTIASVVHWVFSTLSQAGLDFTVSGLRVASMFAWAPSDTLVETYGYLTRVLTAWDGSEQRALLRSTPDRELRYQTILATPADVGAASARVFSFGSNPFPSPLWPDGVELAAAVSVGASVVMIPTAGRQFVAGGRALIWRSASSWEAVTILSVASDRLNVAMPTVFAWPTAGTKVFPLLVVRMLGEVGVSHFTGAAAEMEVALSVEAV